MGDRPVANRAYGSAEWTWDSEPVVQPVREALRRAAPPPARIFELGCGNGALARTLAAEGWIVHGVDPSEEGIARARAAAPELDLHVGSSEDDLAARFGCFDAVVSVEVIEHCFAPRRFVSCAFDLLAPGGTLLLTTPFHGYWKNLALAITGRMDRHFDALHEGGHIKFFSAATLRTLLVRAGFETPRVQRVGRIGPLARSMVVETRRPLSS